MNSTHKNKLREVIEELIPTHNPEEIAQAAAELIAKNPEIGKISISLKLPSSRCESCDKPVACINGIACLHTVASATTQQEQETNTANAQTDKLMVRCAAHDKPLHIHDTHIDGLRGFAVFPLKYLQDSLGIISIFTVAPLTQHHLDRFAETSNAIGSAIFRCRAIAQRMVQRLGQRTNAPQQSHSDIIGTSPALQALLQQINLVAPTNAAVLITGDSGTGKELVANAIHRGSTRADMQLVKTNCASIPRELYESEFFGHVRGAFTGAIHDKHGRFQLADRGTLFLDEVGEIPLELQSKLLRVLQEGEYERLGETSTRTTDVRIVCATNRNLAKMVEEGTFRRDLFYRLNVFPIELPPLRKRIEDIPLLAEYFIQSACRKHAVPHINLTQENIDTLQRYSWPGNVRELQNVIERALIASQDGTLSFVLQEETTMPSVPLTPLSTDAILPDAEIRLFEKQNTMRALEACNHKIYGPDGAAALLGIRPTTLTSRIKKWGLHHQ